jgi:hypothetical protein
MDIIIKREEFFYENGIKVDFIKNKTIHTLAFRLFSHTFVDDAERKYYMGDSGIITDEVHYMFRNDPPIYDELIKEKIPSHVEDGAIFMYIIYHNKRTEKTGVVCANVDNELEFGSKHISLVNYIAKTMPDDISDIVFVTAGELLKRQDFWEFNFFSGTFIEPRMTGIDSIADGFEDFEITKDEYTAMKMSLSDWVFIKRLFSGLHSSERFEFSSTAFERADRRPLMNLLKVVGPKYHPYVIPGNETNINAFEKAVAVVGTFANLSEMNKTMVQVSTWATEEVKTVTTAISINDVDNNMGATHSTRNTFLGRVIVMPYKSDFKRALAVLKQINAKKLEYGMNLNREFTKGYIDLFKLSGKTYKLSHKLPNKRNAVPFIATLTIDKFLASSNEEVYKGKMTQNGTEKEVVLKVKSLYPFTKSNSSTFNVSRTSADERFYGTDIYNFVIPGVAAIGTIYPYLGRTVSDITMKERLPLYNVFKTWLLEKYMSMLVKSWGSTDVSTKYNDYKPANITLDYSGEFHLIDYDERAYTPMFYGPTADRTFVNQMFGVLLVLYWFNTDETPFKYVTLGTSKIEWVEKILLDKELSTLFNIILNDDLSETQKIELIKEKI